MEDQKYFVNSKPTIFTVAYNKFLKPAKYGMRLSHIFEIPIISNEKPSISIKMPSILIKHLGIRSKY